MVVTRQEIPAPTSRPFSRGRPRVWAASTFAATLGVLLRRTAATWEPAHAHGAAHPHPHLRRAEAGTPRPARRAMLSPQCTPFPLPRPRPWWGRGRRHPAVALPGSATPLLWQRFPSELVAARARLPRSLSPPSFPPVWAGGRGCPLSRSGSRWRYQARVLSHPQGGSSAREDYLPPALCSRPARSRRGTHGPRHPLRTVFLPQGKRPSGQNPSLEQAAAPGSRQWQRKPLRALGWRRGARARARAEPGVRARAANRGIPHPLPHAAEAAAREGVGGTPDPPAAPRRGRGGGLAIPRASQHRKVHSLQLPGNRLPKGAGAKATLAALRP